VLGRWAGVSLSGFGRGLCWRVWRGGMGGFDRCIFEHLDLYLNLYMIYMIKSKLE
jgi:hypothetical protein